MGRPTSEGDSLGSVYVEGAVSLHGDSQETALGMVNQKRETHHYVQERPCWNCGPNGNRLRVAVQSGGNQCSASRSATSSIPYIHIPPVSGDRAAGRIYRPSSIRDRKGYDSGCEENNGTNLNERLNPALLAYGTSRQKGIYDRVAFALRYIGIARLSRADV